MNGRKCDIRNVDAHRASYMKHLRSEKQIEKEKQNELIIPDWLFEEPIEIKIKKRYYPESLKQLAKENLQLDDKQFF